MALTEPPGVCSHGDDDASGGPLRDAWAALTECVVEADALTERLRALHARAHAVVEAIGADGATLALHHVQAAHDALVATARLRHAAVTLQIDTVPLAQRTEVRSYDAEKSARRWLARHAGLSRSEANTLVRARTAAHEYDQVDEALTTAAITPAHADLIWGIIPAHFRGQRLDDAIEVVRGAQDLIVEQAAQLTIDDFREFCDRVRDLLDTDGAPDRSADPSRLSLHRTFDGRWHLRGDLAPDLGAAVASLIESQVEHTKRGQHSDEPAEVAEPDQPVRTHAELAAEALAQLLLAGAATGRPGRVGMFLHVELADLLHGRRQIEDLVNSSGKAHTELGLDITDDLLWALMCGGDVVPVFHLDGTPLSYGRSRRLAPEVLAHILRHRDRTCSFPNCDAPPLRLQNHHIVHWEDDGTTDPPNLCGVCRAHHADHHARGWGIERRHDGGLHITRPDGTSFDARPRYLRT